MTTTLVLHFIGGAIVGWNLKSTPGAIIMGILGLILVAM